MQGVDLLTSLIEVSIGIAGFSSVIAAISRRRLTKKMRLAFLQLWIQSTLLIIFCSTPLLANSAGLDDKTAYTVGSYFYTVCLTIIILFSPIKQRFKTNPVLMAGISFPFISLFNAVYLQAAWPYLLLILLGIIVAFRTFYELLKELWDSSEED